MTDQPIPPAAPSIAPPPSPAPALASGAKPGGRRAAIIVGVLVVFLAVVLYMVKDNGAAQDLKVGDCFDIPTTDTVKTVVHHACTEAHTAEVFHVAEFTGSDMQTPLTFVIDGFVTTTCGPAFTTYIGKAADAVPDLSVGYFYPSVDGWQHGDRTITCYVSKTDESSLSASLKGSAGP